MGREYLYFRSTARVFRITRPLVRHAENTAEAFHSKNERPFANGSISAKKPDAISKDVVLLRADL